MKFDNSEGKVFYGLHMCPGVVEYPELTKDPKKPFRVYVSEEIIRNMNPSMAAKPFIVQHPEENISEDLDEVKEEADGYVVESFYNPADGKTWAKFLVVTEEGLLAVQNGYRLSNSYFYDLDQTPGTWNGVPYVASVVSGEFEHLAGVKHPRYKESVVMTPEEFKAYNDKLISDLKRFSNSEEQKEKKPMKLNLWKRTKVENSTDLEGLMLELPVSKKEVLLTKAVEGYDKFLNMNGYADGEHRVKVGESEMSVNELVKAHMQACNDIESMKAKNSPSEDDGGEPGSDDDAMDNGEDDAVDNGEDTLEENMAIVGNRGGDKSLCNDDEKDIEAGDNKKAKNKAKNKATNSMTLEDAEKIVARAKAKRLKNANDVAFDNEDEEIISVSLGADKVARGRAMFGSGN